MTLNIWRGITPPELPPIRELVLIVLSDTDETVPARRLGDPILKDDETFLVPWGIEGGKRVSGAVAWCALPTYQ